MEGLEEIYLGSINLHTHRTGAVQIDPGMNLTCALHCHIRQVCHHQNLAGVNVSQILRHLADVVGTKTVTLPINLDPRFTNESGLTTANVTIKVRLCRR